MKNLVKISFLIMMALFITASFSANAQQGKKPAKKPMKKPAVHQKKADVPLKAKAPKVLQRTNKVIHAAHKAVKTNQNYTGDLSKAVKHQKYAVRLFKSGAPKQAINHSLRARKLAIKALEANKGEAPEGYEISDDESALNNDTPADEELDAEIEDINDGNDEELVKKDITGLDVK